MRRLEGNLLWSIRHLSIEIESLMNRMFEETGLTASQGTVLLYLLEHSGHAVCSTKIHRTFGVARPTISGLLKKLRQKEYIEFQNCEQDDRQKLILPTPKAEALRLKLDLLICELEQNLLEGITPDDRAVIESCLCQIDANLKSCKSRLAQNITLKGAIAEYENDFETIKTI